MRYRSPLTALVLAVAFVALGAALTACQPRDAETSQSALDEQGYDASADDEYAAEPAAPTAEESLAQRETQVVERERELAEAEKSVARRETKMTQRERSPTTPASRTPSSESARPAYEVVTVSLPQTTGIEVEFLDPLSSETNVAGDAFRTRVLVDVVHEGVVAIPAGSEVTGRVAEAVDSKKIGGQARLALEFDRLLLPSGEEFPIRASFGEAAKSQTKKDAATIGGATAGGALLGRVLGKKDKGKYTAIGAVVGAAVGTAIAAKNPGEPVLVETGSVVALALDESVQVAVRRPIDYESVAKSE